MLLHPHEQQYIFSNTPEEIEFQYIHTSIPKISIVQNYPVKRKIIVSIQKSSDEEFAVPPDSTFGQHGLREFEWFFQEE